MSEYDSMGEELEAEVKKEAQELWNNSDNELMALTMLGVAFKFFRAGVKWFKDKKSREKELLDALLAVEDICMHDRTENETLSKLYRIVHVAKGTCKNPHETWREELKTAIAVAHND